VLKTANISEDGLYRYSLAREWDYTLPAAVFVMLNPSTADEDVDDPTIRRCMGFALRDNYGGIVILNLYALRATNPKDLWLSPDPVGPDNDTYLKAWLGGLEQAIVAWGANAKPDRVEAFRSMAEETGADLLCFGTTKSGAPKHPLYLRGDAQLERWK
jgi:hypothetical protein